LKNAAFDLVADSVRVHDLAGVDRSDDTPDLNHAGLALDVDLHRDCAVGG